MDLTTIPTKNDEQIGSQKGTNEGFRFKSYWKTKVI